MSSPTKQFKMMGTTVTIQIAHPNAEELLEEAYDILKDFVKRFSAHNNQSDLMKINLAAGKHPVKVDTDLFELIKFGKTYSLASLLNLNIAIGPLVKLWHIGFSDERLPNEDEIQAAMKLINPKNIELDEVNSTVYLTQPGMEIDLGAVAKGYFTDKLREFFIEKEIKQGIVNIGGNVMTIGDADSDVNGKYRVGIQRLNKDHNDIIGVVEIEDQSVVTSGIYQRKFEKNGQMYHHILDSRTGYPIQTSIGSITIISELSMDCEIWATILFRNTPEEAIAIINSTMGIEGIVIDLDENVYLSAGLHHRYQSVN